MFVSISQALFYIHHFFYFIWKGSLLLSLSTEQSWNRFICSNLLSYVGSKLHAKKCCTCCRDRETLACMKTNKISNLCHKKTQVSGAQQQAYREYKRFGHVLSNASAFEMEQNCEGSIQRSDGRCELRLVKYFSLLFHRGGIRSKSNSKACTSFKCILTNVYQVRRDNQQWRMVQNHSD